jgi:hypothetical protein
LGKATRQRKYWGATESITYEQNCQTPKTDREEQTERGAATEAVLVLAEDGAAGPSPGEAVDMAEMGGGSKKRLFKILVVL